METPFYSALVTFILLISAFSFATAYDPTLLQDFCIATDEYDSSVSRARGLGEDLRRPTPRIDLLGETELFINGKFCKDPDCVTANDFYHSGLNIQKESSTQLGVNITLLNVDSIPGLNTLGLSIGRLDFGPHGLNPPHHHPRGSELLFVLKGKLYAGVITSNPDHRLFTKILKEGDLFVFPMGLVHFQMNLESTNAVAFATFNSQNPGVMTEANALFGCTPPIDPQVLARAFHLDKKLVEKLQNETWPNPS